MEMLPIQHNIDICEHGGDCEVCCWGWSGAQSKSGYGRAKAYCYGHIETYAHRIMWAYYYETRVPKGKIVTHTCQNTLCCNPTHLELVSYSAYRNRMRERMQKTRQDNPRWGNIKLTEEQARWVLAMGKTRQKTQQQMADELGVSQVNISHIVRGRTWRHLHSENRNGVAKDWVKSQVGAG